MELNLEENTPVTAEAEAAPVRRRASRRVSAAAGTAGDATVTTTEAPAAETPAAEAPAAAPEQTEAPAKAPVKRATRSRKKVVDTEAHVAEAAAAGTAVEAPAVEAPAAEAPAAEAPAAEAPAAEAPAVEAPKKRVSRARKAQVVVPAEEAPETAAAAAAPAAAQAQTSAATDASADAATPATPTADETEGTNSRRSRRRTNASASEQTEGDDQAAAQGQSGQSGQTRGRGRGGKQQDAKQNDAKQQDAKQHDAKADAQENPEQAEGEKSDRSENGNGNRQDNSSRSSRTRQRDRKRRGGDDLEPEIAEDDVLLPIAGILDVLDNYAFVRTSGYLPGVSDVYVALGQVKKYGLRRGDAVVGAIRQPRESDSSGRQKYNAIVKIESVNGKLAEESEKRPEIAEMTPVFPQQALRFSNGDAASLGHAIDQHAPMGLGQRALLAFSAEIPATRLLSELAAAVTANAPEAHLLLVQTNARPEEETHLQRAVSGEVITATFDRPAEDQITIAELAIDRARRLVELGHDVVVLLDSLTDLAHAYVQHQQGARVTPEVAQALAITQIKHLLSAARNVENGGSLTLLATARTHSGVAADKQLLREITPVVNSFVKISGGRVAPEINAEKSYTITL